MHSSSVSRESDQETGQIFQAGPGSGQTVTCVQKLVDSVNLNAVFHVPIATGLPQKKGRSPVIVKQNKVQLLKPVNNASCVDPLCSVNPVV